MKKVLFTLFLVVISIATYSQVRWEANAGMNLSKFSYLTTTTRIGFHVGVRGEIPVAESVYANAGLLFSLKGTSQDVGEYGSSKTDAYYVEVPIHIGYRYSVNETISLFGEAGPYFAVGLFGKAKASSAIGFDNYIYSYSDESYDTFKAYKRFDFGLGARVGVEYLSKYTFSVGYDLGLTNIYTDTYDYDAIQLATDVKTRNFYISLGYKF